MNTWKNKFFENKKRKFVMNYKEIRKITYGYSQKKYY